MCTDGDYYWKSTGPRLWLYQNDVHLLQLSSATLFGNVPRVLILFRPDFGQGGGGHHCHNVFRKLEVDLVVVSIA
jgi:hypothetical protein